MQFSVPTEQELIDFNIMEVLKIWGICLSLRPLGLEYFGLTSPVISLYVGDRQPITLHNSRWTANSRRVWNTLLVCTLSWRCSWQQLWNNFTVNSTHGNMSKSHIFTHNVYASWRLRGSQLLRKQGTWLYCTSSAAQTQNPMMPKYYNSHVLTDQWMKGSIHNSDGIRKFLTFIWRGKKRRVGQADSFFFLLFEND